MTSSFTTATTLSSKTSPEEMPGKIKRQRTTKDKLNLNISLPPKCILLFFGQYYLK
jgi:hypothetical protein